GYLSLPDLIRRLGSTFDTFDRLPRHNGHFFNWYNTTTLMPLLPAYISTVDSGNLLGCLWAVKEGLREKANEPVPSPQALAGLRATLEQVSDELRQLQRPLESPSNVWAKLDGALLDLQKSLSARPANLLAWRTVLTQVEGAATLLETQVRGLTEQ